MTPALLQLARLVAHRVVIPSILASIAFLTPTLAAALSIGSEFVTGTQSTPEYTVDGIMYPSFGLSFSYLRSFDGTQVAKDVQINFVFDAALGYDAAQQAAYRTKVEANIEGIWNNKYVIVDTVTNSVFPVAVDMTTTGPRFDQSVVVHAGFGRPMRGTSTLEIRRRSMRTSLATISDSTTNTSAEASTVSPIPP